MTVNAFDEYTRRVAPLPWVHSVWLFPQGDGGQRPLVCVDESREGDALLSGLHPTRGQPANSACHTLVPPVVITRSMLARLPLVLSESAGQISQLSGEERAPLPPLNDKLRRASLFLDFLGNAPTCFAALVLLRSRQVFEVAPAYRSVLLLLHHCAVGENGLLGEKIASSVRALKSSCQELAAHLDAGSEPPAPSAVALVDKTLSLYLDCVSAFDEKSGQTTALIKPRQLAEMSLRTDDAVLIPVAGEQVAVLKKAGHEAFLKCDAQMSSCAMVPVPLTWTALTMQGLRLYPGTGFRAYLRSVSPLEWKDREASEWLGGSWAALLEQRLALAAEQLEFLRTNALDFGLGPPFWELLSRFQSRELQVSRARVDSRIISMHLSELVSLDAAEERGENVPLGESRGQTMVDRTASYRWKLLDAPDPDTLVVVDAPAPTRSDLEEFVARYIEHLSEQPMVQSVYHYSGAYSKADFIPGLSDADFLVVVDDDPQCTLAVLDPKNLPRSGMSQAALSLVQHPPLIIPRSQLRNVYRYALDGPPRAEHLVYGAPQELPQCSLPALTVQAYWHALGLLSRLVWALLGGRLQIPSLYRLAKGATFVARKVLEIERVPLLERYLSEVERLKASFPVDAPQLAAHPLLEIAVNAWSVWLNILQVLQAACQTSPEAHHPTFAIRTLYKSYAVFLDLGQDLDPEQNSGDRLSIEDVLELHSVTSWEFGVSFVRLLLPWELGLLARMEVSAVAAYDPDYATSAVAGELGDEATYPEEVFQVVRARLRTFLEHGAFCRAHGLRQYRLPYFAHVGDSLLTRLDDSHLGLVRDFRSVIDSGPDSME